MSRKNLLWLLLVLLGALFFFCIKSNIAEVSKAVGVVEQKKVTEDIKKSAEKLVKKDVSIKLEKNQNSYTIGGVLNTKEDFKNLAMKYKGLKSQNLSFDEMVSNQKITNLFLSLSGILDKFKSGYVEYQNGTLSISGVVSSKDDKEFIDATIKSISDINATSSIVVEEPKTKVKHIGKLSVKKEGNNATVSGIFTSDVEVNTMIELLHERGLDVKKELCMIDSDLKEDRWKIPFVLVVDDFVELKKASISFEQDKFVISGESDKDGLKEHIQDRLDKVGDDIVTELNITYQAPKTQQEKVQQEVNSILKLKSIRFKTATAELVDESKKTLAEVAHILLNNTNLKVKIQGHTDADGDEDKNLILSQHRADTVMEYLVKLGVKKENLTAVGYGESKPLVKNSSEKNKQINRRVEFVIIGE